MRKQACVGLTVLLLVVALTVVAACGGTTPGGTPEVGGSQASTPTQVASPTATAAALDGQALTQERCATCHGVDRVGQAKKTQDGWKMTVERMVAKGAKLTAAEQDAVIEYLAKTYPP